MIRTKMDERKQAMDELKITIKTRRIRYAEIGQMAGVSAGWVGEVLRGSYPYYQGYRLPKNIRIALQNYGLKVPEILWTF